LEGQAIATFLHL